MPEIIVSEHALLRYIERVYKIDLDPIRQAIAEAVRPAAVTGAASINSGGFSYILSRERAGAITVKTVGPKIRAKKDRGKI
jgi:hypothetical protein